LFPRGCKTRGSLFSFPTGLKRRAIFAPDGAKMLARGDKMAAMKIQTFLPALCIALTATMFASTASAQVAGQPYRVSDREVARLLDRIKSETDAFRKSLKDALNKSRFDRTRREDDINTFVKNFEEETKRLDDNFDH